MAEEPTKPIMIDPYRCPQGGRHQLEYGGKEAQEYYCAKCGEFIIKAELKRVTEKK